MFQAEQPPLVASAVGTGRRTQVAPVAPAAAAAAHPAASGIEQRLVAN